MASNAEFISTLRFALRHLYDPAALRQSPLANLLTTRGRPSTPAELRQVLVQAINALRPNDNTPLQSPAWRAHEILHYRYVQQCSPEDVADQLGLSVRHLKREQLRALSILADHLTECFHKDAIPGQLANSQFPGAERESSAETGDLGWLSDSPVDRPVQLRAVLSAALDLAQPIIARYGVRVQVQGTESLPALAVHAVALRQILLSVLSAAIHQATGGSLVVSSRLRPWSVEVQFRSEGASPAAGLTGEDDASLAVAGQMASACGGTLTRPAGSSPFDIALTLPTAEQMPVLVIDDNADTLRLLQRYATGTRYLISGVRDPEQGFALACENPPQSIILDVMMPETDGWELLSRIKKHSCLGKIPVIVCSILIQEELALCLGADAFLHKPVSRQDFLTTLDHLLSLAQ